MTPERRKYVLCAIVSAIAVALDQWTKSLARQHLRSLSPWETITVIEGFFKLRYSENTGIAFGQLQTLPGGRVILTVVGLAALLLVVQYLRKMPAEFVRLHVALGLIGGGAIGNLIDRVAFGGVTDFIVWHWKIHEWPTFNVADAALCVGVGLMALDMFLSPKKKLDTAPLQQG
jgi:signal peptidase II